MRKTVLPISIFLTVWFFTTTSYSQNEKYYHDADSIRDLLNSQQIDSASAYNLIGNYLSSAYDLDSAYLYIETAFIIADKINDTLNIATAYNNYGRIYYFKTMFKEAVESYTNSLSFLDTSDYSLLLGSTYTGLSVNSILLSDYGVAANYNELASNIFIQLQDTLRAAQSMNNTGVMYFYSGDLEKSKELCEQALNLFKIIENKLGMILAYMQLGHTYTMWGNYEPALNYLMKCKKLIEELGENRRMGGCLMRIGTLYESWENNGEALKYYNEALSYYKLSDDSVGMASVFSHKADLHRENREYRKALKLHNEVYEISKRKHQGMEVGMAFYSIGEVYNDMEELDSAMIFLNKADSIYTSYNNHMKMANSRNLLARVYLKRNQLYKSEKLFLESLELAKHNNQHQTIISDYYGLSSVNYKKQDFKKAYDNLEKYRHLNDSIFNEEMHDKLSKIQTGYEIERKDNEIKSLNENKTIQNLLIDNKNQQLKRQRIAVIASIIIILLILSLVTVLLRQIKKKNNAYKTLEDQNKQIRQSKKELMRAKEKAVESDKLKTAFLANISHEIRNPLNVILGMSEVLAKNNFTGSQKEEYLDMININGELLLGIINDVLDMAKIESGVIKTTIEEFNEAEFFNDLKIHIDNLKPKLNKQHLNIRFDLTDKQINLKSDKYKLNQIFNNLLVNALKFTESGDIILGDKIKDGQRIFYVKDTGIGISETDKKIIFNRFIQADNFLTKKYQGTGLGLAITKSLVTLLDGRIWVESEPGKGSTFYFTIHDYNNKEN